MKRFFWFQPLCWAVSFYFTKKHWVCMFMIILWEAKKGFNHSVLCSITKIEGLSLMLLITYFKHSFPAVICVISLSAPGATLVRKSVFHRNLKCNVDFSNSSLQKWTWLGMLFSSHVTAETCFFLSDLT